MKRSIILLSLILCGSTVDARVVVDKISARVNGVNIMYSQIGKPSITTGRSKTSDDCIIEELWVQRAKKHGITVSESQVTKQIISLKQSNNLIGLDDDAVDEHLKKGIGMTLEQYRAALYREIAVMQAKSRELWERCAVSSYDVESYCKNNPDHLVARYRFDLAVLRDDQVANWADVDKESLSWDEVDWVTNNDLAQHLKVVTSMQPGDISNPIRASRGYVAVRLQEKRDARERTLDERYGEVERLLREEKMEEAAKSMEQDLFKDAVVVRF